MSKVIGIDISKQDFDAFYSIEESRRSLKFNNTLKGFVALSGHLQQGDKVVMEASGPYYLQLANYLHAAGFQVSVVNPLKIRRFCQSLFARAKTDKKDAELICRYGEQFNPAPWEPDEPEINELRQLNSTLELLGRQATQLSLHLSSLKSTGTLSVDQEKIIEEQLAFNTTKIKEIEARINKIAEEKYADQIELLRSIPGIGPKTAIYLIVVSNNFKNFEHYKQFIAYVGLSPRIYQSGSSIRGKGNICKLGNTHARKLLYMCSRTAALYNHGCKQMEERLKSKGKPYKVRRIAVANKLIKQIFAVVKSQQAYDKNYQSKVCF